MSVYRVLVAHNGYRVNEVIETDTPVLRYVKEVHDGGKDSQSIAGPAPESRDLDLDSTGSDLPRKRRKADKTEVTGVEDRAVSDSGLPDSES